MGGKDDSSSAEVDYLLGLQAVRERSQKVLDLAKAGKLNHFNYDEDRLSATAEYVVGVITRDFGENLNQIPPHGRWQHFNVGNVDRISPLLKQWETGEGCDMIEITRRLIDLFMVSVLLDAGAGDKWRFKEPGSESEYSRSEGIAVASLYMFTAGCFSSKAAHSVDGQGLEQLRSTTLEKHFQISSDNPMIDVESRVQLLQRLGTSLLKFSHIFGEIGRPGNLVDVLLKPAVDTPTINYESLWSILQQLLIPTWSKDRTHIDGRPIGDAWPLKVLVQQAQADGDSRITSTIQPFHKLTQWLAYSLKQPLSRILKVQWTNGTLGTGLPEYRNGGLFIDMGVLKLKEQALKEGLQASGQDLPLFSNTSDVVVEWRAMTVALLDELYRTISKQYEAKGLKISMEQLLEAGTWKSGRELAATHRPQTKSSPLLLQGDGTLF